MNREEALKKAELLPPADYWVSGTTYIDNVEDLVEDIYDDFESRTCGNCKHYQIVMPQNNPHDQFNYIDCCANEAGKNVVSYPPMDFGCIKWESRNDN
jgi:hypothetical protein